MGLASHISPPKTGLSSVKRGPPAQPDIPVAQEKPVGKEQSAKKSSLAITRDAKIGAEKEKPNAARTFPYAEMTD